MRTRRRLTRRLTMATHRIHAGHIPHRGPATPSHSPALPLVALAISKEGLPSAQGALRPLVVRPPEDLSAVHSHLCHAALYCTPGSNCFEIDGSPICSMVVGAQRVACLEAARL